MTHELIERAQRGDHEAFEALVRPAYDRLYAVARQEALLRAWRDVRGLRDADRFDAWSSRLLVNACRDQAHRDRSMRRALPDPLEDGCPRLGRLMRVAQSDGPISIDRARSQAPACASLAREARPDAVFPVGEARQGRTLLPSALDRRPQSPTSTAPHHRGRPDR